MKASEIRELSRSELETKISEVKKNMFNLKFQKASGQLDNPMKIKSYKKDVALIETIAREHELGINTVKKTEKSPKSVKAKKAVEVKAKKAVEVKAKKVVEVKAKAKNDNAKTSAVKRTAKKAKSEE
ncbi:MAG TPA: 50S ribosomal protein L29 [Candidatus Humimicrobiaceae bacterium]